MIKRRHLFTAGPAIAAALALPATASAQARDPQSLDAREALDAVRFHLERQTVETAFGRISFVDKGTGQAVLLIHGFPLNGFQWRGVMAMLSGERRCLAPDMLGMGYTQPRPGQSSAPEAQVEMLIDLMDRRGVHLADVIANDSGGAVAQLLTAHHPDRVKSLLLTNCDSEIDNPPPALAGVIDLAREGRYPEAWLEPWFHDKDLGRRAELSDGYSRPGFPSNAGLETYLGPLIASPERKALTNAFTLALEPNVLLAEHERLRSYRGPVRIVWGEADGLFSKDSPAALDALFPNSRGVRFVPGARFFFPEEYPEIVVEEARRLWSEA